MHLEFDFRQSFQGELVALASARICKTIHTRRGVTRGTRRSRGPQERNRSGGREVLWSGTLFLFLRRTSTHLLISPSLSLSLSLVLFRRWPPCCTPSAPPPLRLVPLNKLVRFNDSYFFLVTRLPSFAPTRRSGRLR